MTGILQPISSEYFFQYYKEHLSKDVSNKIDPNTYFSPLIEQLPRLATGPFFWQIYDNTNATVFNIGGAVNQLTPFTAQDLLQNKAGPEVLVQMFHPDEIIPIHTFIEKFSSYIMALEASKRTSQSITIYTRVKNGAGVYRWNSIQYPAFLFDDEGKILYGLIVYTDITNTGRVFEKPMLSILDSSDSTNHIFTCYDDSHKSGIRYELPQITRREAEVLELMRKGKASKEIAGQLNIAKNTVENHRQRILKKFGVYSTVELLSKFSNNS